MPATPKFRIEFETVKAAFVEGGDREIFRILETVSRLGPFSARPQYGRVLGLRAARE